MFTPAQIAKAMIEYGFDWDIAYCAAYYHIHGRMTTTPCMVALSHIGQVKTYLTYLSKKHYKY